ncbi:ABC transporter ATP-binding protein [Rhodococcus erythropolis]|uniref:ABC transporter ATP-binding protein n=1 Tax=Rhodococcus TaxID=1827 RepID=UPI00064BC0CA|nr:ATP-binding cassette domain-containing protein [Rhodococcus sp. ARP2]
MSRLEFRDVNVHLGSGSKKFHAVKNINLDIPSGSVVGLVGESGSGKSTLARATVGLAEPSSGQILLDGVDVAHARGATARLRHRIQMVFQDPYSCLDPRMTIGQSLAEALRSTERRDKARRGRGDRAAEVARLLTTVQLPVEKAHEYPSSLSGGQRQRVALARALAAAPAVLLADEITSALDVSVQGAVLNLLVDLQKQLGLTVLFVSHNLAVIRYVCDHVAVMLGGEIVEHGPVLDVIDSPKEPYTAKLLSAIPTFGEPMFQ